MKPNRSNRFETFENTSLCFHCCWLLKETLRQTFNSSLFNSHSNPSTVGFLSGAFWFFITSESFEAHLVKLKLPFISSCFSSIDEAFAFWTLSTDTSKSSIEKLDRTTVLASGNSILKSFAHCWSAKMAHVYDDFALKICLLYCIICICPSLFLQKNRR